MKIHKDLHDSMGLSTMERWCKMLWNTSRTTLLKSMGLPRTVRIEANISKVKRRHDQLKVFLCHKVAHDLTISLTSTQRILKDDLKLLPYREKSPAKNL